MMVLALIGLSLMFLRNKRAGKVYDDYARGKIPTGYGSKIEEANLREDDLSNVQVTIHTEIPDEDEQEKLHTDLTFDEHDDTFDDDDKDNVG